MKIAIHHRSGSFSERWINYCEKNAIGFKLVNAFDNNIIEQLADCDALLWHHHHAHFKDATAAKKILFAIEHSGIKVYPNFKSGWHFDDKVAQKYLLEAIDAPLVPSYVFYDKQEALNWVSSTSYPKVFKLKGGAGSANVRLVRSKKDAINLVNKSFGKGFKQFDRYQHLTERLRRFKSGQDGFLGVLKGIARLFIGTKFEKEQYPERGYIYFQEFIPNNAFDIRVVVINGIYAAAEKRFVRENDFRASGSGNFSYDGIDEAVIKIAFNVSQELDLQSVAFDFVLDHENKPLIVEISYGFGVDGIRNVPGYWDSNLNWYKDEFRPQEWILAEIVKQIN